MLRGKTMIWLLSCTVPNSVREPLAIADSGSIDSDVVPDTSDTSEPDTDPPSPCPEHMVWIAAAEICIDAYEATLEEWVNNEWQPFSPYSTVDGAEVRAAVGPGRVPQGYISGTEAAEACDNAGKFLCSSDHWLAACGEFQWPYGDDYQETACNDTYEGSHPVVDYFGTHQGIWDSEHMNDPGINQQPNTVSLGGEYPQCVSADGAFDLHGNLHEWVDDPDGTFRGGFYADATINGDGCDYRTTAHSMGYHDYSTGFRCCAQPNF